METSDPILSIYNGENYEEIRVEEIFCVSSLLFRAQFSASCWSSTYIQYLNVLIDQDGSFNFCGIFVVLVWLTCKCLNQAGLLIKRVSVLGGPEKMINLDFWSFKTELVAIQSVAAHETVPTFCFTSILSCGCYLSWPFDAIPDSVYWPHWIMPIWLISEPPEPAVD